jgi:hypothetical protein
MEKLARNTSSDTMEADAQKETWLCVGFICSEASSWPNAVKRA